MFGSNWPSGFREEDKNVHQAMAIPVTGELKIVTSLTTKDTGKTQIFTVTNMYK